MKQLSILVLIFLLPSFLYAQNLTDGNSLYDSDVNANNQFDEMNQSGQIQNDQLNLGTDQQLTDLNGFNNTDSGARNNGEQSQNDSDSTQMLGLIMGAMFAAMCGPTNPAACVMSALSFMDAAASGGNSTNSAAFQAQLLPNGQSLTGNEGADAQVQENLAQLEKLGYVPNSNGGVTTPDGNTVSANDFASVQAMMDQGMSRGQAESAQAMHQQVTENAKKELAAKGKKADGSYALGDSDDGGGGTTIIDDGAESSVGAASKRKIKDKKKKDSRLPASELAGLSRNFNGDPIGIGQANIFLIVKKKYIDKDKEKSFLKKEY